MGCYVTLTPTEQGKTMGKRLVECKQRQAQDGAVLLNFGSFHPIQLSQILRRTVPSALLVSEDSSSSALRPAVTKGGTCMNQAPEGPPSKYIKNKYKHKCKNSNVKQTTSICRKVRLNLFKKKISESESGLTGPILVYLDRHHLALRTVL